MTLSLRTLVILTSAAKAGGGPVDAGLEARRYRSVGARPGEAARRGHVSNSARRGAPGWRGSGRFVAG